MYRRITSNKHKFSFLTVHKKCMDKAPDNCVHNSPDEELVPEERPEWVDITKNSDLTGILVVHRAAMRKTDAFYHSRTL